MLFILHFEFDTNYRPYTLQDILFNCRYIMVVLIISNDTPTLSGRKTSSSKLAMVAKAYRI